MACEGEGVGHLLRDEGQQRRLDHGEHDDIRRQRSERGRQGQMADR